MGGVKAAVRGGGGRSSNWARLRAAGMIAVSEKFNPLKAWLGLDLESKPTYYELLGLPNFESEPPVIADAADRAVAKVAPHLDGPRKSHAEKLLGDLKSVRAILLSPDKRRAYDDQLRSKLGAAAPPVAGGIESLVAPGVEATDSPTMMLPPGALSMSAGANALLGGGAPPGFPPTAAPGYSPGGFPPMAAPTYANAPPVAPAMPYGGMPMAAPMPGMPGIPMAGAPSMPGAVPYAAGPMTPPYAQPPGMGLPAAPGFPQAVGATPVAYGAPGYEYGAPTAGAIPTAVPGYAAPGYAAPAAAPAPVAEPSFAPRQSTMPVRKATARRQKNSNIMVALLVLGGAVAILLIVIFVAGQKKETEPETAKSNTPPPKTEPAQNSGDDQTAYVPNYTNNNDVRVPPTDNGTSSGTDTNMSPSAPAGTVAMNVAPAGSVPDFNTLVPMMAPTGATPITGTTGSMPAPAASVPAAVPAALPGALPGVMSEIVNMAPTLPEDAARAKSIPIMFKGIRTALRGRDYAGAEERALVALVSADTPALVTEANEYGRIVELIGGFWKAVHEGVKTLKEGDEVTVNGQTGPVVRHDDTTLVVKVAGKDVPFAINKLVAASAAEMAQRVLPKDDGATKLVVGTFLGFDNPAEKNRGQGLVADAGASGLEVTELMRILQLPE